MPPWVHHRIWKGGHNPRYLPKEPKCNPQVFWGSTYSFAEESDAFQAQIGEQELYTGTIPTEHRIEEREIKWIKVEWETWHF